MKKTVKILSLVLMTVLMLTLTVIPAFAEGDALEVESVDFPVEETVVLGGNVFYVLEDGTVYNGTTKEWLLPEKDGLSFETNPGRMLSSLQYMWKGMLCIFVVIGVIILATVVMNSLCNKAEEKRIAKENNEN